MLHLQENSIEASRGVLTPEAIRRYHVPSWVRRRLLKAVKEGRLEHPIAGMAGGYLVMQAFERPTLDHWGSFKWKGYNFFATEPFHICMDQLAEFMDLLGEGVEYVISPNSWHFPGATFRIAFWESDSPRVVGLSSKGVTSARELC